MSASKNICNKLGRATKRPILSYDRNLFMCVREHLCKIMSIHRSVCRSNVRPVFHAFAKTAKNAHIHHHSRSNSFITNQMCVFSNSFAHSLIYSYIHSFNHSFIHSFVRSLIHSFILSFLPSFIHLLINFLFLVSDSHPKVKLVAVPLVLHKKKSERFTC